MYEKIKKIASEKKVAIRVIEKDCNISQGSICKWDEHSPAIDKVKRVAEYLNVPIEDLLK